MINLFNKQLTSFSPLTLEELNSKASYLKRIDRKFLLNTTQLEEILKKLTNDFEILEISKKRVFSYDNVYMDTDDYSFYKQHQDKLKYRTKVRTRLYEDANIAFFEYKQKDNGVTKKYRYNFPVKEHGILTKGKLRFFQGVWQSMYEGVQTPKISPSIRTSYKRITLVNHDGKERLTIDFDIKTQDLRNTDASQIDLKNLVIIESKSLSKKCFSCNVIKSLGIKQAKSCSKYSLGVVYAGLAEKYDTFANTMEKIKQIRLETLQNRFRRTSLESTIKQETKSPVLQIAQI